MAWRLGLTYVVLMLMYGPSPCALGDPTQDVAGPLCSSQASCSTHEPCQSPKVCVNGKCACPVLLEGECCQSTRSLNLPGWNPFLPFMHSDFADFGKAANKSIGGVKELTRKGVEVGTVSNHLDFSRCAVVGSGEGLLKSAQGRAIDNHTAVFRTNEAPANPHNRLAKFSGVKTSLRLQNGQRCGFSDGHPKPEFCLGFGPGMSCERWHLSRCRRLETPDWLEQYLAYYWQKHPPPTKMLTKDPAYDGRNRRLSGGFSSIMLALSVCGEVNIFGFSGGGGNHYYQKLSAIKRPGCGGQLADRVPRGRRRGLLQAYTMYKQYADRGATRGTRGSAGRVRPLGREKAGRDTAAPAKPRSSGKGCSKPKAWYSKHYFTVEQFALDILKKGQVPGVAVR